MSKKKRINTVDEIPQWFREIPYDDVNSIEAWDCAIATRLSLRRGVEQLENRAGTIHDPSSLVADLIMSIIDPPLRSGATSPRKTPLRDLLVGDWMREYILISEDEFYDYRKTLEDTVSFADLDVSSQSAFVEARSWIEANLTRYPDEYSEQSMDDLISGRTSDSTYFDERLALTVDLTYDNETLVKEFKKWVTMKREKYFGESRGLSKKSTIPKSELRNWHQFRVLQVFDIDLWQRVTNTDITDQALADFLWPSDDLKKSMVGSPLDRLRNYTRPKKVPAVISDVTLGKIKIVLFKKDAEIQRERCRKRAQGVEDDNRTPSETNYDIDDSQQKRAAKRAALVAKLLQDEQ